MDQSRFSTRTSDKTVVSLPAGWCAMPCRSCQQSRRVYDVRKQWACPNWWHREDVIRIGVRWERAMLLELSYVKDDDRGRRPWEWRCNM